jgi:hypothetical protein
MLIESEKPWQNRTKESFNGKFRDDGLVMSRLHSWVLIKQWREH